jgi:MFS transporter, FSR family, fosmidomycin resistance protein
LGASTQHPIASALVARAFAGPRSLKALGTYNFAGDLGKMTIPATAAFLLIALPWRPTLFILGAAGFAAAAAILLLTPRLRDHMPVAKTSEQADGKLLPAKHAFPILLTIGILDSATRMGFLTFLPFLLVAKGASLPLVGIALTLVFAGGAVGKLVCAFLGARIGATATMLLTESLTTLAIVALLPLPLAWAVAILPIVGVALNGTSSVLYGSVPDLVTPGRHGRAFGIFYTGTVGAGAIAPALYGVAGDVFGLTGAVIIVAATVLLTLPLALILRPALAAATRRA